MKKFLNPLAQISFAVSAAIGLISATLAVMVGDISSHSLRCVLAASMGFSLIGLVLSGIVLSRQENSDN